MKNKKGIIVFLTFLLITTSYNSDISSEKKSAPSVALNTVMNNSQ